MTTATSIRSGIRNIITKLGNSINIYLFSAATKTTSEEGDVTVSSWGAANAAKCADGSNSNANEAFTSFGVERIGEDEIVIRDDETINLNDRVTRNSIEYRIIEIKPIRVQDTLVAQILTMSRVESTTVWQAN